MVTVPLVGMESIERTLRDAFPDRLALHSVLMVEQDDQAINAFDFLPVQPISPVTAATLLTRGAVQGVLRERQMRSRPSKRCRLLGHARSSQVRVLDQISVEYHPAPRSLL